MKKLSLLFLPLALISFLLTGCSGSNQPQSQGDSVKATPENMYQVNCSGCHGNNLQGGAGPSLQHVGSQMSHDQILKQIKNGGGGMPGHLVSDKDAEALATWLSNKQ